MLHDIIITFKCLLGIHHWIHVHPPLQQKTETLFVQTSDYYYCDHCGTSTGVIPK